MEEKTANKKRVAKVHPVTALNTIKGRLKTSQPRKPASSQSSFRPHPAYPNLSGSREEGTSPRSRRSIPKIRFASAPTTLGGSQVVRGFGKNLPLDIRNGRLPSFIGLAVVLVLGYWLLTASNFRVSNIQIKNGHFLNTKDVLAATNADSQNIFLFNEKEAAARIKKLSYVLDARVSKNFPNSMAVEVIERESRLDWQVGSINYLVDQDGVVLEMLAKPPEKDSGFKVIKSLEEKPLQIGDRVDAVAVRSAPALLSKLQEIGFGLTSLDYSPSGGLIAMGIKEQGSRKIVFGTDAELDRKVNILQGLLAAKDMRWTSADLRFTGKPAIQ